MQCSTETVWTNLGAISLLTVVLVQRLMHIHDRCMRRHLPAPQRQALVYVEGLKSITGFHLQSLFYSSELPASCEGTFHACPECRLSRTKTVSVNEWEKGQRAAINYQGGLNPLSAQRFRAWQCIKILSTCKTSLVCQILYV